MDSQVSIQLIQACYIAEVFSKDLESLNFGTVTPTLTCCTFDMLVLDSPQNAFRGKYLVGICRIGQQF